MKKISIMILALATVACSTYDYDAHNRDKVERLANEARERDSNPKQFYYKKGFADGCQSGKNDWLHPFKKDIERYVEDKYYKTGWDDGHTKCKADYEVLDNSGW